MKYNQFINILTFTVLFMENIDSDPDYYLEKANRYLGDIKIKRNIIIRDSNYCNSWTNINQEVVNLREYVSGFVGYRIISPKELINCFNSYFISDVPNIISGGLHPNLYTERIKPYLEIFEEELKDIKRIDIISQSLK